MPQTWTRPQENLGITSAPFNLWRIKGILREPKPLKKGFKPSVVNKTPSSQPKWYPSRRAATVTYFFGPGAMARTAGLPKHLLNHRPSSIEPVSIPSAMRTLKCRDPKLLKASSCEKLRTLGFSNRASSFSSIMLRCRPRKSLNPKL